ncbi:unnamed protein product [Microthlaspi erraticum]|uniref:Flavin-containing monooxygenase n=1 Tax=Microthlaspi erraticum TaxID=1685480 RepID=A0A6D2JYK4_9BRAS|nr:unnamed protein product [Microthlaspi erraticum]
MAPSSSSIKSRHVAVIGAGAAGLVAARELRREGHSVVVFERQKQFGIEELIRFETTVVRVSPAAKSDGGEGIGEWRIESTEKEKKIHRYEIYDAVVVCNGHYIEPRLAEIPGISYWPGKKMHSHNYRLPQPFKDQVVVLIGNSSSADDISRDIAGFAKEVHVASWSNPADTYIKQTGHDNMWMHSMNGETILADVIMHCTGYKYDFSFLDTNGSVAVDNGESRAIL